MFYIYILYSKEIDRYYIGSTYDLNIRFSRHLLKTTQYTKRADDWSMVYHEGFSTRAEAVRRERFIKKKKSRKYIETLVSSTLAKG